MPRGNPFLQVGVIGLIVVWRTLNNGRNAPLR
jgi:hypothetical protein